MSRSFRNLMWFLAGFFAVTLWCGVAYAAPICKPAVVEFRTVTKEGLVAEGPPVSTEPGELCFDVFDDARHAIFSIHMKAIKMKIESPILDWNTTPHEDVVQFVQEYEKNGNHLVAILTFGLSVKAVSVVVANFDKGLCTRVRVFLDDPTPQSKTEKKKEIEL